MNLDPGKQAFLEEAREYLGEIEEVLLELEADMGNPDMVGRLFRAMHTIKGSGAMFGFAEIARFTHELETVYDRVRSGSVTLTRELLALTLAAKDHILSLLDADDPTRALARSDELIGKIRGLDESRPAAPASAAGAAGPIFEEQTAAGEEEASGPPRSYIIRFRPGPESCRRGTDPLLLIDELSRLGPMWGRFHDDDVPALEDLDPGRIYGWWDLLVVTGQGENAVRAVFIFAEEEGAELIVERFAEQAMRAGDAEEFLDLAAGQEHELAARLGELFAAKTVNRGKGAPTGAGVSQEPAKQAQTSSIRVDAARLDKLVNLVGELVIAQSGLAQAVRAADQSALPTIAEEFARLIAEMRDHALGIRMVPIGEIYAPLRRLVRDLSVSLSKDIAFVGEGAQTELDKNVIDRLKDPLVHILRNSADHSLETPEARRLAGKPEQGTIRLAAGQESGQVVLTVSDDGTGINLDRVRAKAVERGLIAPDAELSKHQIIELIFQPGFSTAGVVSNLSGRGVGMDVVRQNIEALRGEVTVDSVSGQGTTLTIRLPLTLAIIDGLQVRVGRDFFIIPLSMVEACQERPSSTGHKTAETICVRGQLVPCLSLRRMLGISGDPPLYERVIIARVDGAEVGLAVDAVVGQQQAVIKSLSRLYKDVRWVSGTTINGDGGISLIVDVPLLVRAAAANIEAARERSDGISPPSRRQ